IRNDKKRKISLDYTLSPGLPHTISSINYVFPDSIIEEKIMRDSNRFVVKKGSLLDRSLLDAQRELITQNLRNQGYYEFAKEFITFNADTTSGSYEVDLTMTVNPSIRSSQNRISSEHKTYRIGRIIVVTDFDSSADESLSQVSALDTIHYKDLTILYGDNHYLRPSVIYDNCFLHEGEIFRQRDVDRTYRAFSRLNILKFTSIRFHETAEIDGSCFLDAYILLTPGKSQSIALEIEGTNSEGDLGIAASATYTHRNIAKGSETLTTKVRGAYESLSGNLEGLLNDRYMEYSADFGINFPKFKAPFLSENFKRRINATTELNLAMTYQERPEYTRVISNAGWSYKWTHNRNNNRYIFTPIDINYVYLPKSTYNFIDEIAPDNPLLRYSYEDHFIMRLGFSFYHSNKRNQSLFGGIRFQRNIYTVRANVEFAGNLLYLLSNVFTHKKHAEEQPYKIFGIHYSQYFKINSDFSFLHSFDTRNSIAFHLGLGLGYPYGNSSILPFEKRFYGGGANGVRGWDVRTLGPGKYPGTNSVSDFINQCGDIRFDLSTEYRAKLFWVLELGAFIDAGNIWTIHNYPNQPGGMFHFNSFYKEIAAAYGLGMRMDFNYFLIRFDLGMKAHNPAMGQEPWPIIHPKWGRDRSFHFSIG
ncbi:MAG: BamA/TamA family outer membrane protein, partial [Muribaculaceae bacterium]|nr:BamA/TamA family outer membrane protein [Muribaculaceae bacterium]